jgi:signal transduction histidine kinase
MTAEAGHPHVTYDELRTLDLFDGLSDEELAGWAAVTLVRTATPGEILIEQGEEPPGMLLLLAGTINAVLCQAQSIEPFYHHQAPAWLAAVPSLTEAPMAIRMVAASACRIAVVPAGEFRVLARSAPSVHRKLMREVGPVISRITAIAQSRERLAGLGTVAAGLAHELNNPAAAAKRAAAELERAQERIIANIGALPDSGIEREAAAEIMVLAKQALRIADEHPVADVVDASEAEEEMLGRLERMGVAHAWRVVGPVSAAGLDQAWLDSLQDLAGPATGAVLNWVAATLTARNLVRQLRDATERISDLVAAVKAYAYMDRGGLIQADVHEGIESTLTILGHKLRDAGIRVERQYDRTLPPLTVYGSELNQVWTNLLDNAIDAAGRGGRITITTSADNGMVRVDVADSGPGIPPGLQDRVFDPFFTTKQVGHGTGLGLGTSRRIVQDRHGGRLAFDSGSQGTVFHAWLPLRQS